MQTGGFAISNDSSGAPASTMAYIKGSGNDNTTTSLLVQNSDGANAFRVTDNRIAHFFSHLNIDGQNYVAGNLSAGSSSVPSGTRAYIKGSGATSATTALLVQNSAGTELLKVNDAGNAGLGASPTSNTRAYIKSAGSTSATNALIVQNSLSTNLFKVQSDGKVYATNLRSSQYSSSVELLSDVDFSGGDNYTFSSTTGGFLPPRMTDAERDAIATPAAGLMIYDTSNNQMNYWNGSTWIAF
jgi:hypothetical protein